MQTWPPRRLAGRACRSRNRSGTTPRIASRAHHQVARLGEVAKLLSSDSASVSFCLISAAALKCPRSLDYGRSVPRFRPRTSGLSPGFIVTRFYPSNNDLSHESFLGFKRRQFTEPEVPEHQLGAEHVIAIRQERSLESPQIRVTPKWASKASHFLPGSDIVQIDVKNTFRWVWPLAGPSETPAILF